MDKEQAKSILRKVVNPDVKEAIETLIPELNENEEERNWKAVLDCVKDDALKEWLKKQKEQKHLSKFDVDAAFDAREPRDNWEYIKEFCDKFGRMPKDMDELDELVSYVMVKKQRERKPIISAEESLGISQEEYSKIVDECIYGEDKEQKPAWMKIDNSEKNVVFPFKARVKDSDKVVTIIDGQLNFDGKQWIKFASNRDDGFKVYCPEDLLVEQSVECIEFDNEFKNQVSHLLASVLNKEWEYNKGFVEYAAQQLLGYAKHEIKSVGWSEKDERILENIYAFVKENTINPNRVKCAEECLDWLKLLLGRFNLQPKQEWDEEDDEMLVRLLDSISIGNDYEEMRNWLLSKLKYLLPQPEHELGEENENLWVHDDDIFLDAAKMIVEDSPRKSYGGVNKKSIVPWFYSLKERLKSLRHFWKPGEEQMRYLLAVINEPNNAGSESCHIILKSLYRDLKKLK